MNTHLAVARVLAEYNGPGVLGSEGVWQVKGNARPVECLKERILELTCLISAPIVHYDGDRPDGASLREIKLLSQDVWRVPQRASGKELLEWLYMGNWQLYLKSEPLLRLPDLCRASANDVRVFLRGASVALVIDSFHDDVSWTVGLAEEVA